jgi:hypothetical protein
MENFIALPFCDKCHVQITKEEPLLVLGDSTAQYCSNCYRELTQQFGSLNAPTHFSDTTRTSGMEQIQGQMLAYKRAAQEPECLSS